MSKKYYLGWDVGAWNCDKNHNSKDALVLLDSNGKLLGNSKRMNLKKVINDSKNVTEFIYALMLLCELNAEPDKVILAIDTPLGFSSEFKNLIMEYKVYMSDIDKHAQNPYLFRSTERHLFEKGFSPLSSVKDMIGSQATKGIHVISKFGLEIKSTGIWTTKDKKLTVIETYPSLHKHIKHTLWKEKSDELDAYRCAYIAYKYGTAKNELEPPQNDIPEKEGWIWYLKDIEAAK